ncbi:MAG: adenylate/guanylate cyclase domain-containing protein, partial [Paracoccaceae bacterium]
DAVNVAARIEQAGAPGRINLSESTFQHVKAWFDCEVRGSVEAKNKGAIPMHFLNRIAPAYAADPAGTQPNDLMRAGLGGAVSSWSLGAVPVTSPA